MTLLPTRPHSPGSHHHHAHQLATPASICLTGVMFSEGTLDVTRSFDIPQKESQQEPLLEPQKKQQKEQEELPEDQTKKIQPVKREKVQESKENSSEVATTKVNVRTRKERLFGTIRYRIFRPRQLHMLPAPLVVIHGGPGVPSNYLMNLVNVITDRTVLFYDQIGCGRSSRLSEKEAYSLQSTVDDLRALMKHWNLTNYHLFGHSFGGIVAFEFLKQEAARSITDDSPDDGVGTTANDSSSTSSYNSNNYNSKNLGKKCLSLVLASVPTESNIVDLESKRLLRQIRNDGCDDDQVAATFSQTHECRVVPTPLALLDAYAQAGSALWRGISAIPTYKAQLDGLIPTARTESVTFTSTTTSTTAEPRSRLLETPCCILRGQYDFVTDICVEGWNDLFVNSQSTVLSGCSHHGLLENEQLFGHVVLAFLEDQDL